MIRAMFAWPKNMPLRSNDPDHQWISIDHDDPDHDRLLTSILKIFDEKSVLAVVIDPPEADET
jgi:hypothetical protein